MHLQPSLRLCLLVLAASIGACRTNPGDDSSSHPPNGSPKLRVVFVDGGPSIVGQSSAPSLPLPPPPQAATASLIWTAPSEWKSTAPSSPMRLAQYAVPGAEADDAELAVFHFGSQETGSIDETFQRWLSGFDPLSAAKARRATRTVRQMRIHTIEAMGTFDPSTSMAAPVDASSKLQFGLLGAVVEAPDGAYYFKMMGPDTTVAGAKALFLRMLDSCRSSESAGAPSASAATSR